MMVHQVHLVQVHHCTIAPYAYGKYAIRQQEISWPTLNLTRASQLKRKMTGSARREGAVTRNTERSRWQDLNQFKTDPQNPNQEERRVIKMLMWSMMSRPQKGQEDKDTRFSGNLWH